ncbi:hypothetical protein GOV08_03140 [Candidatus Woesearchaeota archaeon]|nr:hypothetical protein [Candidatus Woesearchaeota archaeon]
MKIGIVGPTKVKKFCKIINMDVFAYVNEIVKIVKTIVSLGHELVLVPEKGSVSDTVAVEYKKQGGKKVYGIIPMDDTEFGIDKLNQEVADEIINCCTWRNQAPTIVVESDILLSFGFGTGTLGEIMGTKYYKKIKTIVIEDFITQRLPIESKRDVKIEYVKTKDVSKALNK